MADDEKRTANEAARDAREAQRETAKNARKQLHAERKETQRQNAEAEARQSGKPTPTQEEADLIKLGALHPDDKESDGSPVDDGTGVIRAADEPEPPPANRRVDTSGAGGTKPA